MPLSTEDLDAVGMDIIDLGDEAAISRRRQNSLNGAMKMEGLHRLANAFVEKPFTILQELVNAAVRLCGADSAGISVEREGRTD